MTNLQRYEEMKKDAKWLYEIGLITKTKMDTIIANLILDKYGYLVRQTPTRARVQFLTIDGEIRVGARTLWENIKGEKFIKNNRRGFIRIENCNGNGYWYQEV